jgi:putative nucleotidyltransferase with HDIG domain
VPDSYLERFNAYASAFDLENERIHLKYVHMLKVADISLQLASELQLDERMTGLAHICGLFHDIGRFRQVERFGTFSDAASVDHADFGADVICEEGLLDFLRPDDRERVVTAIRRHNKFEIGPDVQDPETLVLCRIVRAADTADIYRVFATERMEAIVASGMETLSRDTISDGVYDCLMQCRCVHYGMRKTSLEKLVASLGFLYDVNYAKTLQIIAEQGYWRMVLDRIEPERAETRERLEQLLETAKGYIAMRVAQVK